MRKKQTEKQKKSKQVQSDHFDLWSEAGEAVAEGKSSSWDQYPRPQMRRTQFMLLKDGWTLNGSAIRMPFPPQAMLSGYEKEVGTTLVYETKFEIPDSFFADTPAKMHNAADTKDEKVFPKLKEFTGRILLHFGAVDQIAEVYVNGVFAGKHEGGYLPFCFDITEQLEMDVKTSVYDQKNKLHTLKVFVTDALDQAYPYGKQTKQRGGMWYTQVSGIWQNVWLEPVPENYIRKLVLNPDQRGVHIQLDAGCASFQVQVDLGDGRTYTKSFGGNAGRLELADARADDGTLIKPRHWTFDDPYLYNMKIQMKEEQTDEVATYFALRTISIEKHKGIKRVCLNGKPIFLHAVLDQGYYSDGLYLPAKEEEYEQDILRMKQLGYNMLRKHIKVEPEYFYYACDRLGMLVMQDMVNNGPYSFFFDTALPTIGFKKRKDTRQSLEGRRQKIFLAHTKETIEHLYNHPSIVAYTIFNEGWGQFHSDALYDYVKKLDRTRLIDATSGWFAQNKNDFDSEHIYFKVKRLEVKDRPLFLSECGGYSLQVDGHYYNKNKQYGYGACSSKEELTDKILHMYQEMVLPSARLGMCGCVYTQLSDVEDEINGLYTYDRKVCKVLPERMIALAKALQDAVE